MGHPPSASAAVLYESIDERILGPLRLLSSGHRSGTGRDSRVSRAGWLRRMFASLSALSIVTCAAGALYFAWDYVIEQDGWRWLYQHEPGESWPSAPACAPFCSFCQCAGLPGGPRGENLARALTLSCQPPFEMRLPGETPAGLSHPPALPADASGGRAGNGRIAGTAEDGELELDAAVLAIVQAGGGADELFIDLADVADRRMLERPQVR